MKRRFLSLLTAFALCLTLIPTTAFADDEKRGEDVSPSICETACTEESKLGKEQPNAIAEDEGSSAPADDELGSDVVAAKASPAAMRAANGISARAANGTITLGSTVLDITQSSVSSTYDTTGGFKYDAATKTLTLRNCTIDTYTKVSSEQLPGIFKYYNVFLDSRNVGTLNIVLEGSNYIGNSGSLKYMSATSDVNTPRYLGIWSNTVRFSGSGSLTIEAQTFPIQSGGIETSGSVDLTLRSYMNGTVTRSMAVGAGTSVTAEAQGNNLDFYALNVKNDLTVNGTLNATTKGCVYQNDYPVALLVGGTLRVVGGQVTATSDGRNGNDGCQGYGIKANVLEIGGGGTVRAYSNGYSTKTNRYDGKEAIYVSSNLTVDLGGYLYAKTQNPILSNENENGALKVNGRWDLSGTNGDTAYTKAVITKPVNGSIYKNVILGTTVSPEKEVEISGIRNAVLVLSYYKGQYNEGKTWYYRNADRPGDTDSIKQNVYSSGSTQQELNLKEGFSKVLAADYNNYYGIDVREGEHTVVLDGLAIVRDHTFLTVRSGATLNLKLTGKSCLESGSAPTFYVEQGGTLNLIGGGMAQSSLALMGGLSAASGATVNFKDCAIYAAGKTIGGTGANVSVENCWISAGFAGNLRVTRSTLEGEHSGGTVKIDRRSNANLTDASGKAVTGVTDHSGNPVYRTKVELEDMGKSRNLMIIAYRTDATVGIMQTILYPLVTQLRVNIPNTVNDDVIKDLTMLVSDNTVYLWLPNGTRIMSVEGFQDDGSSPVGFIHDPQKGAPIVTTADNSASGKMILLSLLLASGVLAFRGTPGGNNTALCAGYLGDSAKDTWIDYRPEKDVKLQADWKFITDFGIRMLTGGEAEVKLNGLDLSGPNKRVELDDRSKLSIVLMENTESAMESNHGSTDAVWTLKGSGGLTIKGQSGGEKLTLRGDHAMDGSTGASLTFNGITLINNCTNKPVTTLGKLTISNSLVFGLGTVNCANVVINGGSVDLDVPVNTVVKDSNGNELKKVTLTLSQKNTAVEDVTLSGLPEGTAFNDSHVTTDGSGKLYLWIPKDAEVVTVTVGGNKYYPKSDGSMTLGDVPVFTSPTEDVSCVVESSEYMTLTVEVTGTPAPALQWQVSRDGGKTWENIEGATEATYQALLPLSLHGAKFRCAATNKDGTTYSHTFTAYYCPAVLRGAASPMRGNGEFIQGEIATITAGFYDGQTWYPISSLTGVTAEYRWKYCRNVMPTEEEWAAIPPAGESYPITITDEMGYQSVCFHVTLTYPDNTVKTVTGYWRLNVCVTPVVTEQPQSVSAAAGDSVTFSAKLIDQYLNTLEYQWQSSTDGGQNWTDIEGAGGKSTADFWNYTPSYTIPSVTAAQSGQLFRCVLWNTNNHTGSDRVSTPPVYSEPATLTVTPPAHEHRYGDWSKDGTNHWHECTDADCPEQSESIKDKEAHVYTDDADTTCNVCGYVRTVTPEIVPVSQITLNKAETSISVGNSETLTATVAPENATIKALTWASSDEDVATVAPDGTVTAVKAGAATITATAADGSGKSAVCKVTVTGDTTPPAHEHRYGDWSKDGTNHWHECTDAACPNQSESIKDKAAHVYTDDADTTCNVCGYERTVTPEIVPVSQITLNKAETSISVGNSETLTATVAPENATIKALTWASSDEDVATVAPDGTVTAVKAGAATITATAADGSGKSAVCKVTVTGDTTPPAHEHRYGDWSKDGTNHWHECTDAACPEQSESIKDKAAHVYTDDADTTCNICGYVRTVTPPAHEHRYGDWSKDGTNHWHECTDAACPNQSESIKDKEAHVYTDDADTTCNVCGYVRTVTPPAHEHRYGDWSKDGTNHWHECTDAACPNQSESIKDKEAHVYDDDADTTCNVCGYVRTVTPPAHEHRYGDWSKDGTNHWHECTDNDCPNREESIKDKAAHVYDDDADTTCNICGYVRTVTPEIVPVSQITLNKAETSISVGNSETLTATVAPENAANKALIWASSDEDVATVAPDGTVTAVKAGAATITATAADGSGKSATCTVTVIGGTTPSQPGGSTGGNTGGSSSDRDSSDSNPVIKTETKNNTDGSTTKTETRRDGSVTQTTTGKDGSVTKTETKRDGSSVTENKAADGSTGTVKTDKNGQTEAAAKASGKAVEDAKKNGEAVKVPVEVEATRNSSTAPTVSIELPKGAGETKVEIPVSNVTPGTVAVLVHPDGTEEILKDSIPTEDGIQLTVDGSATVKIVDNSKGFIDTRNHWAEGEIDFVSARGLVNGMSATIYAPNASTTRAQLWTILARQNDANLNGGNTWYEKAQNWAKDKGVSDGANPNAAINRAQMVTMLWRAMGQPTAGGTANFTDVPTDSYYAQAVAWAVENGITTGVGNGHFDPTGTCTRAQIAAFLARSMK
ncbi:Ig-like domain-containing protein [Oscillospiraceae bacterium HCN-4035]